jgi:hypothetical protein
MTPAAANSPKIKQVGGYLNGTRADSPHRDKDFDVPFVTGNCDTLTQEI